MNAKPQPALELAAKQVIDCYDAYGEDLTLAIEYLRDHTKRPKPALTAEAWMLLRMVKARVKNPVFNAPKFTDDFARVITHLNRTYGHKEVLAAIDSLNQEYDSAPNPR